jgi:hypothetical protein
LTVESRRPAPDEMVKIFTQVGLDDAFWDPQGGLDQSMTGSA